MRQLIFAWWVWGIFAVTALVYAATGRLSLVVIGSILFFAGSALYFGARALIGGH